MKVARTRFDTDPAALVDEQGAKLTQRSRRDRCSVELIASSNFFPFVPEVRGSIDGIVADIKASKDEKQPPQATFSPPW